ncbi:MAG TPA: restriction endonuclease [Candidatus Saccharimonadales bacterium]|nr:restriction endonuclease [Candidatus Saccharimonadales bacterium]
MKKGKYYEQKTADIVKKHNPQAQVLQNVRIVGKLSKISREVDVQLVNPSDYDQIIFECKDHKAKVDIELVEALNTKLQDLGAKKAAIVSNSGFTKGATNIAKALEIDLLTLVDTADPKIRTSVYAPNIVEDTYVEAGAVRIEGVPGAGIPANIHEMLIKSGDVFVTWPEILAEYWNTEQMKQSPAPGDYFLATENATIIDTQCKEATVDKVDIRYTVRQRYYLRNLRLLDTQGIYNVEKGTFQTSSITTESIVVKDLSDPNIWKQIDEETAMNMVVPFRLACATPMSTTDSPG